MSKDNYIPTRVRILPVTVCYVLCMDEVCDRYYIGCVFLKYFLFKNILKIFYLIFYTNSSKL